MAAIDATGFSTGLNDDEARHLGADPKYNRLGAGILSNH
jgi:hypothetical protein